MFRLFIVILYLVGLPAPLFAATFLPVTISTHSGEQFFHLEVADTQQALQQGLMFRKELPVDGGMLFSYQPPRPTYMWMRNTLIPLDMIFVSPQGRILHIEHSAEPHSEQARGISAPVAAVLEVPGGTCTRLGIAVGDAVRYALPAS
jgi:uncharacterized membrane protein (UPF0127 family)